MNLRIIMLLIPFNLFIFLTATAQQVLNVTGSSKILNDKTYSYSIGEMSMIDVVNNHSIIISQGFLQPEQKQPSDFLNATANAVYSVYPNPTHSTIIIQRNSTSFAKISLALVDGFGKTLMREVINMGVTPRHPIDLSAYAPGTYLLLIEEPSQPKLSFKIQKIN